MGYELRRDLREVLGPDITGLQRAVALEIADDANERTRESFAPLEDIARWTGAKDAGVVRNALKRLAAAGWEFRVPIGQGRDGRALFAVPGRRMTFRVPPFAAPVGVAPAPPSGLKGERGLPQGGAGAPSEGAVAPPYTPQGGAGAHSEGAVAPSEGAVAPPFSSYPSPPHREEVSNRGQGVAEAPPSKEGRDYHWQAFGAFWLTYPKKRDREAAKTAWAAAIDRGATPQRIVAAATAYARERANEDPKYTKHPANWLDKGCYDDEPDPHPRANGRPALRSIPQTAPRDTSHMTQEELANALNF